MPMVLGKCPTFCLLLFVYSAFATESHFRGPTAPRYFLLASFTQCTYTGFIQGLEFLKKSGNLQASFPDLDKVWKIKIKSGE